ncbi:hypothetical protein Val02_70760 [Virgisporangium aliadipatigenens]|uniref:Uncharacterized protein n=1 Tax=Virgisporangium aliadipatigenens TaxID=741659 RepID=A0A8J3YUQ7_9ACTN|nr:hypothetical protein [Virgisporangium aliadipatigenens]GIJ50190.1 hypothetical protein Val02_70760 [Virgisporangium aliadipatigenens]
MSEYDFYGGEDANAEADAPSDSYASDSYAWDGFADLFAPDAHDTDSGHADGGFDLADTDHGAHHDGDPDLASDGADDFSDDPADHDPTDAADHDPSDVLDPVAFAEHFEFDASFDLIGAAPHESSWWADLTSDNNHDGAYETVSWDGSIDPYVAS